MDSVFGQVGALGRVGGSQVAERLGNRAINQKVAGLTKMTLCPLGKALHLTCLGGNVPVVTVSRSG